MFCEKCGTKLPENAVFCTNCGSSIQPTVKVQEKILDNEVQLNVRPTFKLGYLALPTVIIYWAIALIFILMFALIDLEMCGFAFGLSLFIFILIALFFGIGLIFKKQQYKNYSYDFYKTKVIFQDSFLNKSEKEVKYKYIREVGMRQSFFQRFFDLGNIILYTNAETGYGNGIFILNITNVQETYKKIKTIIDV